MSDVAQLTEQGLRQTIREEMDRSTIAVLVRQLQSDSAPGDLVPTAQAAARPGYLLCDGGSYLRADYHALFVALGGGASPFGLPDGTHFNVPDFRDRVPVGVSGSIALGATGGTKTVALVSAELAAHSHTFRHSAVADGIPTEVGSALSAAHIRKGGASAVIGAETENTGSGTAHNNMQPYIGMNWLVKV